MSNAVLNSTTCTVKHDDAGNLIDDCTFVSVYDAWNRLVKVQSAADSGATVFQTAEFDGAGRRIKKVVTNSGDLDGTVVYLFDGQKIIETRDGSNNVYQEIVHGRRYIDEVVMVRVTGKGDMYVIQDANWNVIGMTDLGGSLVEVNHLTPYGELTVDQETGFGDRDGDGDVDATDKGTPGTDCTGTVSGACRILDLDFDGDYDSADATLFDALPQGSMSHPGLSFTAVDQPFAHQGLLFEPEIGSYQNRARQYDPVKRRLVQRDPLASGGYVESGNTRRAGGRCDAGMHCVVEESGPANPIQAGRGYHDGLHSYGYLRSSPIARIDPLGMKSCGTMGCGCGGGGGGGGGAGGAGPGNITIPVDGNSIIAGIILLPLGGSGCVTLAGPTHVSCTGDCEQIKKWKAGDNDKVPILNHECCHVCDLEEDFCKYFFGIYPDTCSSRSKTATPNW